MYIWHKITCRMKRAVVSLILSFSQGSRVWNANSVPQCEENIALGMSRKNISIFQYQFTSHQFEKQCDISHSIYQNKHQTMWFRHHPLTEIMCSNLIYSHAAVKRNGDISHLTSHRHGHMVLPWCKDTIDSGSSSWGISPLKPGSCAVSIPFLRD